VAISIILAELQLYKGLQYSADLGMDIALSFAKVEAPSNEMLFAVLHQNLTILGPLTVLSQSTSEDKTTPNTYLH